MVARGVVAGSYVSREPLGGTMTQLRLVQPMVMAHAAAFGGRLRLSTTLDLEGWTIPDGELTIGAWGEGFVDRRHPHTFVHEVMLSGVGRVGSASVSLSAGKGFAAFGSEDPGNRPTLRFPVNHHWSQILERAVLVGAVRAGPVLAEASIFNGDEPQNPWQAPNLERFGDSWSARLRVFPVPPLQVEASYATVRSPEHRSGSGTDQRKWHASLRWSGPVGGHPLYALAEWARSEEGAGRFVFHSWLAEGAWDAGAGRVYYRAERTERPEEERLFGQPTRTVRPQLEDAILGTTRWMIHTVGAARDLLPPESAFGVRPFVEVSHATVTDVGTGVFNAAAWYGGTEFWGVSLGVTVGVGRMAFSHKMGRYGVAEDAPDRGMSMQDH